MQLAFHRTITRYRTTMLGPLWIVLGFVTLAFGMAFLSSALFDRPLETLLPYVVVGLFGWNLVLGVLTEGPRTLFESANLLQQSQTPVALYPIVATMKQIIIAAHNLPVVVAVVIFVPGAVSGKILWSIPGLAAIILFAASACAILAIVSAYIPDIAEIVASALRFIFFFTPIFWMAETRPGLSAFWHWNPFYYFVEAFRGPVLGTTDPSQVLPVASAIAGVTAIVAVILVRSMSRNTIARL
jgi:ABC-type polysaccharide/polyol phosphate export permease